MRENCEISESEIKQRIKDLSSEIKDYYDSQGISSIYYVFILTSSFVFAADLMRELSKLGLQMQTDVITVKSYIGTKAGELTINAEDVYRNNLDDKNVLVVDDILDTGATLTHVRNNILQAYSPQSLEFCCLLKKEMLSENLGFNVKFIGFEIPDKFVVGYGLDCDGKYREFPFITTMDRLKDKSE